jgi:pyruvate dehydrogenase E1 component alpha subunit
VRRAAPRRRDLQHAPPGRAHDRQGRLAARDRRGDLGQGDGLRRRQGRPDAPGDISVGAPPSNAIVGANIPIATGAAIGFKLRGLDRVAVSFFGDGAANIGPFHEGINLAAVKDAPVIFVCENNLYGASTHASLAMKVTDVADRAAAYGIPGVVVDGMDVTAVYEAAREAVSRARGGKGPTLLELKTYRYLGHSRGDPCGYRSKEEVAAWQKRDPIPRCRALLVAEHGQDAKQLDEIEAECQGEVEDAVSSRWSRRSRRQMPSSNRFMRRARHFPSPPGRGQAEPRRSAGEGRRGERSSLAESPSP